MGKILVTKKNYAQYFHEHDTKFYVNKSMILSPSVKDILRDNGIVIVYGERPTHQENSSTACKRDTEELSEVIAVIAKLLKEDFCMTDQEKICYITKKVLECMDHPCSIS